MPWKPAALNDLERKIHTLQTKLLQVNSALRLKTLYCEKLEYLLHQRHERIDQLFGLLEQARRQNAKLDEENEHLVEMDAVAPGPETACSHE